MSDIMEIAWEGALKTQIMYKANLSFIQLNNYIAFLLSNNLMTSTIYDSREGYVVTMQGLDFLQEHSELVHMLKFCEIGSIPQTVPSAQSLAKKT